MRTIATVTSTADAIMLVPIASFPAMAPSKTASTGFTYA
jgi:hypothetical protein